MLIVNSVHILASSVSFLNGGCPSLSPLVPTALWNGNKIEFFVNFSYYSVSIHQSLYPLIIFVDILYEYLDFLSSRSQKRTCTTLICYNELN